MPIETIRDKIKTQLATLSSIAEIQDYITDSFNKYPATVIAFIGSDSDYETTAHNERQYNYDVSIFQASDSAVKNRREATRIIQSITDEILDLFDKDQQLSGISMPSGKTILAITPLPSEPVYLEKYVAISITLIVRVEVNIT